MVEIYSINLWALKLPCFSYENLTQPRILQQPYSLIFPALNKPRSTPQIIQPHTKKKKPSSSITNTSHRASSSIIFSNLENQPPCHFLWSLIVQATKPFPSLNPWATPAEHIKNTDSSSIFNLRRGPSLFMAFILVLDQDFNSFPSRFSKTDRQKVVTSVTEKKGAVTGLEENNISSQKSSSASYHREQHLSQPLRPATSNPTVCKQQGFLSRHMQFCFPAENPIYRTGFN